MAHPDDAELWAGGTISRHIRAMVEPAPTPPTTSSTRAIVVVDSGLNTADELRFQTPGVLGAQPAEIAEERATSPTRPTTRAGKCSPGLRRRTGG